MTIGDNKNWPVNKNKTYFGVVHFQMNAHNYFSEIPGYLNN